MQTIFTAPRLAALLCGLILAGCAAPAAEPTDPPALTAEPAAATETQAAAPDVPTPTLAPSLDVTPELPIVDAPFALETLRNSTYSFPMSDPEMGEYPLTDGEYVSPDGMIMVKLLDVMTFGDIDGDGNEDVVTAFAINSGGSGVFVHLAGLANVGGAPEVLWSVFMGDRVTIYNIDLAENDFVAVNMLTQGPDDAFCCPTLHMHTTYELEDQTASSTAEERPDRVPAAFLRNMTFFIDPATSYTLTDGIYEDAVTQTTVTLLNIAGFGDLNGDGVEDAVVALSEQTGGTGNFIYLVAVLHKGGALEQGPIALLGDREIVHNILVEPDGTIRVEATAHADADPACCPTLPVMWRFRLNGEFLIEVE